MASVNPLNPKERVKIPRQHPRELDAETRRTSFLEVSAGFDEEQAVLEASRCLECRDPVCVRGCPVNVDIPDIGYTFVGTRQGKRLEIELTAKVS